MKIIFVCAPFNMTGGNRVIAIYARFLQSFGHDVLLVAPPHSLAQGFLSRLLRKLRMPPLAARSSRPSHMDSIDVPIKLLNRPRKVRESDVPDADVIVATWWETAEFILPMPPTKGRKVYFVQHHEAFDGMPSDRVAATYRSPMQKVVVAEWLIKAIEQDGNRASVRVVPNAVDKTLFFATPRAKRQRPRLGTLFSETAFKGFDTTLDVIARVRAVMPDLEVVAFGELAPDKYKSRVDGIRLTVRPDQESLRDIYTSCDVWLCCSTSEGFNLVAMEAMACRTPVVSTRTGWPAEAIVDGLNGALAEVGEAESLAAAVLSILRSSDADWSALSEGAARTVADSSWERSARLFEAALIDGQK
jgi:glycosyltransferase involved in cell wall biosynthesis